MSGAWLASIVRSSRPAPCAALAMRDVVPLLPADRISLGAGRSSVTDPTVVWDGCRMLAQCCSNRLGHHRLRNHNNSIRETASGRSRRPPANHLPVCRPLASHLQVFRRLGGPPQAYRLPACRKRACLLQDRRQDFSSAPIVLLASGRGLIVCQAWDSVPIVHRVSGNVRIALRETGHARIAGSDPIAEPSGRHSPADLRRSHLLRRRGLASLPSRRRSRGRQTRCLKPGHRCLLRWPSRVLRCRRRPPYRHDHRFWLHSQLGFLPSGLLKRHRLPSSRRNLQARRRLRADPSKVPRDGCR